ncbi:MAG: hypothetical protein PHY30_01415 [Candidatus Pacebacteria bacterium]|nr:hypothetical protein [Candidatus Paceibacterota bacterium]
MKVIKYLLVFFFLILGNFCYAGSETVTSYWCDGGCGGEIVYQTCSTRWTSCCGDSKGCKSGKPTTRCGEVIKTGSKANSWQVCMGSQSIGNWSECGESNSWSSGSKFYFVCSGKCLPNVSDIRYYNNPNYPRQPELTISGSDDYPPYCSDTLKKDCIEPSDNSSDNVKLPLKIDWDEDPYWINSSSSSPTQFAKKLTSNSNYEKMWTGGPQSYLLKLELNSNTVSPPTKADSETFSDYISKDFSQDAKEIKDGYFIKVLNLENQPNYIDKGTYRSSEYNFRVDHNPCWLKSGQTYNLTIQTCCNADGTECNNGGSFNFTTSYAPELKSPEDLDWSGSNYSAWNPWAELVKDDYDIDVEGRILSLPNNKYNPFDWANSNPDNFENKKINFPIMLDWCDVDEVNGEQKIEKGAWQMKLFQVILNEDNKEEEVLHPGTINGTVVFPAKPIQAGADWTDLLFSSYYDEKNVSYFTENEKYSWEIESCLTDQGACKGFGEHWSFETADSNLSSDFYILNNNGDILGIPTEIRWVLNSRVNSAKYSIPGIISGDTNQGGVVIDNLELNKDYAITVIPCSDYDSKKCEPENAKTLTFRTTGAAPVINDFDGEQYVPLTMSWKNVSGAKSYIYNLNGQDTLTTNTLETLYYPKVRSDTSYSFKVKTCADEAGHNCGEYSPIKTFRTKKIEEVKNISTEDNNGILYTNNRNVSWEKANGASYYKYALAYVGDDTSKTCTDFKNKGVVESITQSISFSVGSLCSGSYNVSITACLDSDCNDHGNVNNFSFKLDSKKAPEGQSYSGGLIPCNREYDDPETAWDETLSCGGEHIFLIIRLILDFFLSRLLPAALVVLLLYDGGLYLFHTLINYDNPAIDLIKKSKSMWIAVGIGFLIIFIAWTAINFFLLFFSTNMSFFELWVNK